MHALWPPYWSGPAWAAIVTGRPREETGIYEDLALRIPGLPTYQIPVGLDPLLAPLTFLQYAAVRIGAVGLAPPARAMLRRPPFWEPLTSAGMKTAVVRFPFTYPANDGATMMVSDAVGRDAWSLVGVSGTRDHATSFPPPLAASLADTFAGAAPRDDELTRFIPDPARPRPAGAFFDPVPMLRLAWRIDRETLDASESLVATRPDLDVVAVYLGGFDTICHAFWQYRPAGTSTPAGATSTEAEDLAPVVDRYVRFLDERLGELIRGFPRPPNVIIVSDHGYEADPGTVFKGRHGPEGIFIASGPAIAARVERLDVSYYDVVPTIRDVLRLPNLPDALGASRAKDGG
jgi:predicted AlkP superfamily phosphohydrolase/phosphomutase